MTKKLLSIVVPTYNMEAYLPRCLDSVTRKDVPESLEVIVVNDGSTDESLKIAKEYQVKRPDIISIINKPNGHYGSCINTALKVATGKYFRPLDADDWFDTNALIQFLQNASNIDSDLFITNYVCHRKTNEIKFKSKNVSYGRIYNSENPSLIIRQDYPILTMHSFTYKLNLLRNTNTVLSEGINYTDTEYVFLPLAKLQTFTFLNIDLYHYDLTREGQSVNSEVMKKNYTQYAFIIKRLLNANHPFSSIEKKVLGHFLKIMYYKLLFNSQDDKLLKEIDDSVASKDVYLKKQVNKSLLFAPILWQLTGMHFFWHEKLKKLFGIDR